MYVYISWGNSDNKLSQNDWANFCDEIADMTHHFEITRGVVKVHGRWHSLPNAPYQNACIAMEFSDDKAREDMKKCLRAIAEDFLQDSIAWVESYETEMLRPSNR